jgi:hypothetical protein
MLIANPIYDVFFIFLLEDEEIAIEFIGTIIDEAILELTLQPKETDTPKIRFRSQQFTF